MTMKLLVKTIPSSLLRLILKRLLKT